jgi:hypothetical protein
MIKGSALERGLDTKTANHLYFVTPYSLHPAGIPQCFHAGKPATFVLGPIWNMQDGTLDLPCNN